MASPLSFIANVASAVTGQSTRAATTQAANDDATAPFAALLGEAGQKTTATASASAETGIKLGNVIDLTLGFGGEGEQQTEDPEALAAVIEPQLPVQWVFAKSEQLTALVDGLAELNSQIEAGEAIDPKLLQRLDGLLTDLAEGLGIDLKATPKLDDLLKLSGAVLPDDTSIEAQLTRALVPLAGDLQATPPEAPASRALAGIGEKLAALVSALNSDTIAPEKLATLGLDAELSEIAELDAALTRLTKPAVTVDATADAQILAKPELVLTEKVLTGKAGADAAITTPEPKSEGDSTTPPIKLDSASPPRDDRPFNQQSDNKPADHRPNQTAPVIAAAVEQKADTVVENQGAVPSPAATRVDALATPRAVQVGYQTSQQQLNLPQLAFEIVRQASDGNTRFQIRLDPAELGRIDVKLDIDASGQVNARLIVEKPETLDLMQRDQRGLEKALQQAGLDGAKTNLEFSLRQNLSGGQQGQDGNGRQPQFYNGGTAEPEEVAPTVNLYRGSLSASGVNIIA